MASAREIILRRPDLCVECDCALAKGSKALWNSETRTVTCLGCRVESRPEVPRGSAGASAIREYERRRALREEKTRADHPLIGEVLLAVRKAPQHEVAFKQGAQGEAVMARSLEKRLAGTPVVLLHDRRMPAGRGNIDHLAVAPSGIYVIDAKNLTGKVRVAAPLVGQPKLIVKGRDRTKLIDGLDRQVAAVSQAFASEGNGIPISGALCFLKAELPLIGRQRIRGHELLYRNALVRRLKASGPLDERTIQTVAIKLAAAFPAA